MKKRYRVLASMVLVFVLAFAQTESAFAYYSLPGVSIMLSTSSVWVVGGQTQTISVSVSPAQELQLPGCGDTGCPQICGPDCFDPNGWCVCGGTTYLTYYTQVSAWSSDNSVAYVGYGGGFLSITGVSPGTTTIVVQASLAKHVDSFAYVTVSVSAPLPSDDGAAGGNTGNTGSGSAGNTASGSTAGGSTVSGSTGGTGSTNSSSTGSSGNNTAGGSSSATAQNNPSSSSQEATSGTGQGISSHRIPMDLRDELPSGVSATVNTQASSHEVTLSAATVATTAPAGISRAVTIPGIAALAALVLLAAFALQRTKARARRKQAALATEATEATEAEAPPVILQEEGELDSEKVELDITGDLNND